MRRFLPLIASLGLAACVTGIPDADPSFRVPKAEPCEIVVTVDGRSQCMSRARWERDYRPVIIPGAW